MYALDRLWHLNAVLQNFYTVASMFIYHSLRNLSRYSIITQDYLIPTAYGQRDEKYTYIDTITQSYRNIASRSGGISKVKTYVGVVSRRSKFDSAFAHRSQSFKN